MKTVAVALLALALAAPALAQQRVFATEGCIEATPGPVNDLTAVAKSERSIVVAWNAPSGTTCVDEYKYVVVKQGQPMPRSGMQQAVRSYSLTIDNLEPNTVYEVKVMAVNSMKGAGAVATATVKTRRACPAGAPGPIGNVFANQASSSVLYLSWLPPSDGGCTGSYEVLGEETNNSNKKVLRMSTTTPEARAVGLAPGVSYTFRITPFALNGGARGTTKRITFTMRGRPSNVVASGSIPAGRRMLA